MKRSKLGLVVLVGVFLLMSTGIGLPKAATWGVTGFTPTGGSPVPIPTSLFLLGSGLIGLVGFPRRWRK